MPEDVKDVQIATAKQLYDQGESMASISRTLGLAYPALARTMLVEAGIAIRRTGRPRGRRLVEIDLARATALYEGGSSLADVAEILLCSPTALLRRLTDAGVPLRRRGPPPGSAGP